MVLPNDCMENVPVELHEKKFNQNINGIVRAILYVPVKFEFEQKNYFIRGIKK